MTIMKRERFTNTDHETLVLQRDGRLRITRVSRFSSGVPRLTWISGQDAIFGELLRWAVRLDTILGLPGFETYAPLAED